MTHSRQYRCTFIFIIVAISQSNGQRIQLDKANDDGGADTLPSDFMNFVKALDTMVFRSNRKKNITDVKSTQLIYKNPSKNVYNRRYNSDNIKASQNAAIRDVLMLKLVSYYEDKYNVRQTRINTTPKSVELPEDPKANDVTNSIERAAIGVRKMSRYAQNPEDINALYPNSQPIMEEVVPSNMMVIL